MAIGQLTFRNLGLRNRIAFLGRYYELRCSETPTESDGMSIHVVLCDDQPDVARMISCRLMRADFEVHTAHDAESAWSVIQRVHPQLLITDLQFPGFELLCRTRSCPETADMPVIVLSSLSGNPEAMEALQHELRLSAILPKPFSLRKLVSMVTEVTRPVAVA